MENFYSEGGNNRPYFSHRIKVRKCSNEMYEWCLQYPTRGNGYFQRFHVEWASVYDRDYDIVQFESEEPAIMFMLKFGDK